MRISLRQSGSCMLAALSVWFLSCFGIACAQQSTWEEQQRKAISLQETDEKAALELYRSAIKDAATAKAPIEKQLGLLLQCGDLLYQRYRLIEAKDVYAEGIRLAHENGLKNWEARFLLMSSSNNHMLFGLGLSDHNDPAPCLQALALRPGVPNCPTDFHTDCLRTIGNAYLDQNDYPNAEKYLYDALAEAARAPNEQCRVDDIIRSLLQMQIRQKRYADATRLLVEASNSQPAEAWENKVYFFGELNAVDPETATIFSTVESLLKQKDYAGLDAYADKLRRAGTPTISGRFPMDFFLSCVDLAQYNSEIEWKDRLQFLSEWVKQRPDSDTAKIALADTLTGYAWKARGTGWADTVTKEGWRLMAERLKQALAVLRQVKTRPPEWYSVAQRVALGQSWRRPEYEQLVNECRSRYPKYNTVIFGKAYWLQPKWHGQEGEAIKYINSEANRLPGLAGDVLYAQIAWSLDFSFDNVITGANLDWTRTKRGLKEIIKQHPESLRTRGELAFLAERMGDRATQLSVFRDPGKIDPRIKLAPKEYAVALQKGKDYQREDKREEAITEYSKAIAIAPNNGEPYYRRSEMYLMTNRLTQALSDINKCLEMFPEWQPALAERGRIECLIEKYPESIADLEKVLALSPNDGNALSMLGQAYDAMGNHQRALDLANFDVEVTEQGASHNLYYAYQDRGLVWSNARQYEQAANDLRKGSSLRPQHSQLWAYLAYVNAATDRLDQATEDAAKLFATEKFAPRGYRLRAEMHRAAGQWEQAIEDYNQSTSREPTFGPGFWQLAVAEMALGKYEQAETDLRKSVSLMPSSALAYSYLALVEELQGNSDASKEHMAKAFALTPDLPMNYVNRARINFHSGALDSAAKDCAMALKLDNRLADAYAISSQVLAKAGQSEAAAQFDQMAKTLWWRAWPVPIAAPQTTAATDVSIALPVLNELQPQPFFTVLSDCAP